MVVRSWQHQALGQRVRIASVKLWACLDCMRNKKKMTLNCALKGMAHAAYTVHPTHRNTWKRCFCIEITPFIFFNRACMSMSKKININILNALSKEAKRNWSSVLNTGIKIFIQDCKKIKHFLLLFKMSYPPCGTVPLVGLQYYMESFWTFPDNGYCPHLFPIEFFFGHNVVISLLPNTFCCQLGFCFTMDCSRLDQMTSFSPL